MKSKSTLKTILIILIIVLLSLVSFGGIFVTKGNKMKNVIKDYSYGMDFSDRLLIGLKIKDEEKTADNTADTTTESATGDEGTDENTTTEGTTETNSEETVAIAKQDVEKTKKLLKSRLEKLNIDEYYIRMNEIDGSAILELPGDMDTDYLQDIVAKGNFQIMDADGTTSLGDYNVVKEVKYKLDRTTYTIPCVEIEVVFNKDFVNSLLAKSGDYAAATDENGQAVEKKISLQIDGTSIYSDNALDLIEDIKLSNSLKLFLGQTDSTEEDLQKYYTSAEILAMVLEDGPLPVEYTIDYTDTINSNLSINSVIIVGIILLAIAAIYAIYKYKAQGIGAIASLIGYIAAMLLAVRYTNIEITFLGIFAIGLIFAINYAFILRLLENTKDNNDKMSKIFSKTLMQFINVLVICFIIAVVFSLQPWAQIQSFGTIIFWGLIILVAYNYLVTKNLVDSIKNK